MRLPFGTIGLVVVSLVAFVSATLVSAEAAVPTWRITKDHWDASDEKGYEEFVTGLGAADCWTIDECIKGPGNPYRNTDPRVKFLMDCADVPYFLRAYYAWKNGLPFGWQNAMQSSDGPRGDIRYSSGGTNTVSTAMYRRDSRSDSATYFADTYSPSIDRKGIRPGTIAYDVNGHVSVVWRVETNGRILIFSSHPDHTMSRSFVGREFLRTGPELGSIFQNWRPIRLVGAKRLASGVYVGGRLAGAPNADIPEFSRR